MTVTVLVSVMLQDRGGHQPALLFVCDCISIECDHTTHYHSSFVPCSYVVRSFCECLLSGTMLHSADCSAGDRYSTSSHVLATRCRLFALTGELYVLSVSLVTFVVNVQGFIKFVLDVVTSELQMILPT